MNIITQDDKEIPLSVAGGVVRDSEGAPKYVVTVLRDVTIRKKMENEMHHTLNELKAKNKELDDYVHMTSHDMKAPLVTIQGFADLLKRKHSKELSKDAMHYVDTIISGASDMNNLVTDLLMYSRAEKRKLKLAKVAVSDVIQSSIRSLKAIVDNIGATVLVPDDLPVLSYDSTHLKEVFNNLLVNALEYSKPKKKPKIEIGWKETKDEDIIWIKDNGVGIKEEHWDKIFKPFERIARDKKGSGLGLSIVKKIVERHEGRIWVESKFGEGSTFHFTIPKEVK